MSNRGKEQNGRAGVGCILLAGLVLLGAGCFTSLVAAGGAAGVLRDDPQGVMLLGVFAALIGIVLVGLSIARRRG
jgi:hypothetical protein